MKEVGYSAREPATNGLLRDEMPTGEDTIMNSFQSELRSREPQEEQMHPISILSQPGYQGCLTASRQSRLESEVDAGPGQGLDPLQHEPSRLDGQALRIEGREAGGDQVGVDEFLAVRIVRKEQAGEGALAGPFGPATI